jgi:hypothetical protein
MKLKTVLITISSLSLLSFLLPSQVFANAIFPHTNELLITNKERTKETISFKNDSLKDVQITPVVYSYDPQTVELTQTDGYLFTRTDKEIFTIKPKEVLEIEYEVVPSNGMRPGTYFNLITLEKQDEDTFVDQTTPIGAVDSLSHLVVLHIADSEEGSVYGITSEFAKTSLEIVERGIPFIKPTVIKYTYQNITDYVLNPMGEIQVYSEEGNYAPTYLKINKEQEKLYPGGLLEEEFGIDQHHISDLYSNRIVIGRFYNGIDENLLVKEITLEPNYTLLIPTGVIIVSIIVLLKAIFTKKDKKKDSNNKKAKKNPV